MHFEKFLQRKNERINDFIILIIVILLASFFLTWKLSVLPPDLDGEVANIGYTTFLLTKAASSGIPYLQLVKISGQGTPAEFIFSEAELISHGISTYHWYLEAWATIIPLWVIILYFLFHLFGSTKFAMLFGSALVGILAVVMTYLLGKRMYGKGVGFFSGLFLTFSLFFLINARSGYGHPIVTTLVVVLCIYFIYLACVTGYRKYFWFLGIFGGLGWFNGYSPIVLVPIVAILSFFWTNGNFKFLKKGDCWIACLVAFLISFTLSLIYSVVFNLDTPLRVFNTLNLHWFLKRAGSESLLSKGLLLQLENVWVAVGNLFLGVMHSRASHQWLIVPGRTNLTPVVSIFLILGMASFLQRKQFNIADKVLITWIGVSCLLFIWLVTFQFRYILSATPALYILATKTMFDVVQKVHAKDMLQGAYFKKLSDWFKYPMGRNELKILLLITLGIILNVSSTYYNYFVVYANNDGYLWRFAGNHQIADYIHQRATPEESQVVFGHQVLVPAENFIFYTQEKYPIMRLDNISKEKNISQIQDWERDIFARGKGTIFYVFSMDSEEAKTPGKRSWGDYEDLSLFTRLHPRLEPAKIIYYTCGLPTFSIYEVSEPPRIKYDYHLGIPGQSMRAQTFVLGHPILERVKFQVSYVGKKVSLSDLIVELRKTAGEPPTPDLTETGLLASIKVSPSELNLERGKYSTLSLPYSELNPEATYAIVLKQERVDEENHYVLAGQTSDIYEKGRFGYYDGSQWIMSDADANFIPLPADYTIESTATEGIHTLRILERLTSAKVSFKIIFKEKEWEKKNFDQKNLRYEESNDGRFKWLTPKDESGGYLVYKVGSPYLIKSMKLITNPRIHNDREKENFLRFSYSTDGKKYYEIYKLQSNGDESWTGIYEREMRNTIYPKSKVVYLRFDFNQVNAQLWATKEHPIILGVEVICE